MITLPRANYRPLAISLLLHALLLVLLSIYVIKPMLAPRWYEFDLAPPEVAMDEASTFPGAVSAGTRANTGRAASARQKQQTKASQPQPAAVRSAETSSTASDLLETPALTEARSTAPAVLPRNPLDPLRGIPTGLGNSGGRPGGSLSYSLSGGQVSFLLPIGYKHDLGATGSATLKFRLDQYARPIPGSIEAMEQSGPRFFEEGKKVLQQGKFSFTGAPVSGAEYTITFNFVL